MAVAGCGLIVHTDDSEAMAGAICCLADDVTERQHLCDNVR